MDNAEVAVVAEEAIDKKKTKRDKVRSAWISFAGRIVAQIVGAIATVALGVMVLHRYTSNDTRPPASEPAATAVSQPAASAPIVQPPVQVIILTPAMLGVRDADERSWADARTCTPQQDGPSASAAHLDQRTLLSR